MSGVARVKLRVLGVFIVETNLWWFTQDLGVGEWDSSLRVSLLIQLILGKYTRLFT